MTRGIRLDAEAFAARMAQFAPFEANPLIAVAVSGGRDSLALTLLADEWVRARDGLLLALVVDHGLRPGSASEALQVKAWLEPLNIETEILTWQSDPADHSAVQARARGARYRLLADRCAERGILHLLVAHHAEDQAETFVHRLLRDSGMEGLAAISACVELPEVRILRPLLDVRRDALTEILRSRKQTWLDDPSNDNPAYARVRLRQAGMPAEADSIADAVAAMGRLRAAFEARLAAILAECAEVHPLGGVMLDPVLHALPLRLARAVVARAVVTSGGRDYPPRSARLSPLVDRMRVAEQAPADGRSRDATLGGSRVLWRQKRWVITRDPASIAPDPETGTARWDGRFALGTAEDVRPLGVAGWARQGNALRTAYGAPGLAVMAQALPDVPGGPAYVGIAATNPHFSAFRPLRPLVPAPFFPCFAAPARQMLG